MNINTLSAALRLARDSISSDVTVQRVIVLLCVADNPGVSQNELAKIMQGISPTALSRNLADLSAITSRKQPGPGLIRQQIDPNNLRRKQLNLTAKGKRLVDRILRSLDDV